MRIIAAIGLVALLACAPGSSGGPGAAWAQDEPVTYLAEEDTFDFGPPRLETMTITAKRVGIEQIIQAIAERLEADEAKIKTHQSTLLTTVIAYESDDPESGDYTIYEAAERQRVERGSAIQTVRLWERERKYRNGELQEDDKKDKEDEEQEMQAEWYDIGQGLTLASPFTTETGGKYRYELLDRQLVGNNVVYKILFEPKNRFDALPSGTVWVDYTDLVLRRIEARFADAVPVPMFLKAVPFLRLTQKKMGDYWVADEVHARVDLRDLPLPDWPARAEFRMVIQDHVINGVAYDETGRPVRAASGDAGGGR